MVKGLLSVDIQLADKRIIQVDGPSHFQYTTVDKKNHSAKDILHDAIIGKPVIHLPFDVLDSYETEQDLQAYLAKSLALDIAVKGKAEVVIKEDKLEDTTDIVQQLVKSLPKSFLVNADKSAPAASSSSGPAPS